MLLKTKLRWWNDLGEGEAENTIVIVGLEGFAASLFYLGAKGSRDGWHDDEWVNRLRGLFNFVLFGDGTTAPQITDRRLEHYLNQYAELSPLETQTILNGYRWIGRGSIVANWAADTTLTEWCIASSHQQTTDFVMLNRGLCNIPLSGPGATTVEVQIDCQF